MAPACAQGNIEIVELGESEGHLTRKLVERLFTSVRQDMGGGGERAANLAECWDAAITYETNSLDQGVVGLAMQASIFTTAVSLTAIVAFKTFYTTHTTPGAAHALYTLIVLLPVARAPAQIL